MGRRWLGQLCAGKMMVCLDRRSAEATFLATVVMPDSRACPIPPGIKAPLGKSLPLVQTLPFPAVRFGQEAASALAAPLGKAGCSQHG